MDSNQAMALVVDAQAAIGEGPTWDTASASLLWVDILGRAIHRYDPTTDSDSSFELDKPPGAVVPAVGGGLLVALDDGCWISDEDSGFRLFASLEEDNPLTRANDGKCDRRGRFWIGTMARDETPSAGALYRVDAPGSVTRVADNVSISNGIAWSPDNSLMYYIDSAAGCIDVFDYDFESGSATGRRRLTPIPRAAGIPDGMTVDTDGGIWVAMYDGWAVRRFTPDGELDRVIHLPVSRVTSCAFGGNDLGDLYITSARHGLTADALAVEPLAGGLFRYRPGEHGIPEAPVAVMGGGVAPEAS